MSRAAFLAALATAAVLAPGAPAEQRPPEGAAEIRLSFAPVVKAVVPSVVNIYATRVVERAVSPFRDDPFFSRFFDDFPGGFGGEFGARPRLQNSLGSGVILGDGNIVVSNFHVVGDAAEIRVVLSDRREFDAEVLIADPETDLAVLRLDGAPPLPGLDFADSDAVEVGDLVLAVGNPFGVGQTVSSGIVSAAARAGRVAGRPGYFIQTDAPINPGNSGGALVGMDGRLVGVNTAIVTRSGGSDGIGFAIPSNLVRRYVEAAEAGEAELPRPWAGVRVQPVDGPLADALGLDRPRGVLVNALHPLSPLAEAGIEPGDVVTAVEGRSVDEPPEMLFRFLTLGAEGEAEIAYLRGGEARAGRVRLAPAPEEPPREPVTIGGRSALAGLTVANLNPALVTELDLPFDAEGVVVTAVEGRARRAGLRPGDVILSVNGRVPARSGDMERLARLRANALAVEVDRGGRRAVTRIWNR